MRAVIHMSHFFEIMQVPAELRPCFSAHHQVRHGTMMLGLVLRKLKAHARGNSELAQLTERMEEALKRIESGLNNCKIKD